MTSRNAHWPTDEERALAKAEGLVLTQCDCSCATRCPHGRIGASTRCWFWIAKELLGCLNYLDPPTVLQATGG